MNHLAYSSRCRHLAAPYLQCVRTLSNARRVMDPSGGHCHHQKHEYEHCKHREHSYDINAPVLRATNNHPGEAGRLGVSATF